MIEIERQYVEAVHRASTPGELADVVQNAIELEHATIPPYLTAMMSLKPQTNREVWELLHSVVIQEMLHMSISANVLIALGGCPAIDRKGFVPTYPGPLPMGVRAGLIVPLERYSPGLVERVFMSIEEPEDPIEFPRAELAAAEKATIGEFYEAIQAKLSDLPPDLPGPPDWQVTYPDFFDPAELFPIRTTEEAIHALQIIIDQGEGTPTSPLDPEGGYAHYYRFEELAVGRRLVPDPSTPKGYSFTGPEIPFDPSDVWPIKANTKTADLPADSEQRHLSDRFNFAYSKLLAALHRTFNGEPDFLPTTLSLMFDVKLVGERLVTLPYPGEADTTVGPSFEYVLVYAG